MKRSCLFALLFLMVTSLFAEHVDPETARKVATAFLNNNGLRTSQLTDLSKEAGFTNLYIFNGNPGFVVMAADNCVQPVLGYSLTGSFEANNLPENLVWWLQGYNRQIQDLIDNASKASADVTKQWSDLISGQSDGAKTKDEIGPYIETNWDQTYPYNYYCPTCSSGGDGGHVYTGCVATAMAQVLKYHNYPAKGVGFHDYTHSVYGFQSAIFGETTYNWSQMPARIYSSSNTTQQQAVATLIYHCGVAVDMNYGNNGSGAHSDDIAPALKKYFNYSQSTTFVERSAYSDEAWIALMRNELDAGRPIVYGGMDSETNPQSGHSFVCDGYGKNGYGNYYFNFNWGWSGYYNGYFSIDNMTPGGSGAGGGSHNYSFLQDAVIGIKPSTNNTPPTNLTSILDGTTVTLHWTNGKSVSSYNVYCNNQLIGNVSTNSYTGTAPYGTSVYYVQSVDANGELSLPTNSVSVEVAYSVPTVNDLSATFTTNNAALTWSAPAWCYPQTPSLTLTYGDGIYSNSLGTGGNNNMYWGQRFPAANLTNAQGMVIYKISFYVSALGTYECYVYQGSNTGPTPKTLLATYSIHSETKGWFDIVLDETLALDSSQDLWVILHDTEYKGFPAAFCVFSEHDEGSYFAESNLSELTAFGYNVAWLIRTCLTDGTYTYNLYQDGVKIANKLTTTTYNAPLNDNAANLFVVKTNYYDGEVASNMIGYCKGNASVSEMELQPGDLMTITNDNTLTVTGTLKCPDPTRLILEDGAQLIHNSTDVKATVEKRIAPYSDNSSSDGWHFIASPVTEAVTPSTGNGLLNGTYDLYYYNEPTHYWMNYRAGNFDLVPKQGYLYATDANNNTLHFAGTLTPSNAAVASNTLSWSASNLKGFNLIGNPFACNANVNCDFYVIDDITHEVVLAATDRTIAPGEGVFVQATAGNQTVTFTKASGSKGDSDAILDLVVSNGKTALNRIRVRKGEGAGLEMFSLNEQAPTRLALYHDGEDYAVVQITDQTSLPVLFHASQNGSYTFSVDNNSLNLNYLHLIDHLTGADIDLLQNPSYSFEAQPNDYASRFKLVFNPSDPTGEIGDGFVEGKSVVIDMTGRVVATKANTQLAPGVYILRTVDGNETHSQKIIIK